MSICARRCFNPKRETSGPAGPKISSMRSCVCGENTDIILKEGLNLWWEGDADKGVPASIRVWALLTQYPPDKAQVLAAPGHPLRQPCGVVDYGLHAVQEIRARAAAVVLQEIGRASY